MLSRSSWSYIQGWVDLTGLAYRPNAISQLRLSEVRLRLEPQPPPCPLGPWINKRRIHACTLTRDHMGHDSYPDCTLNYTCMSKRPVFCPEYDGQRSSLGYVVVASSLPLDPLAEGTVTPFDCRSSRMARRTFFRTAVIRL